MNRRDFFVMLGCSALVPLVKGEAGETWDTIEASSVYVVGFREPGEFRVGDVVWFADNVYHGDATAVVTAVDDNEVGLYVDSGLLPVSWTNDNRPSSRSEQGILLGTAVAVEPLGTCGECRHWRSYIPVSGHEGDGFCTVQYEIPYATAPHLWVDMRAIDRCDCGKFEPRDVEGDDVWTKMKRCRYGEDNGCMSDMCHRRGRVLPGRPCRHFTTIRVIKHINFIDDGDDND